MKYHAFLIKYAEIGIKGKNRYLFEDVAAAGALISENPPGTEPKGGYSLFATGSSAA